MPKVKKAASSSDSDSGPEDRNPVSKKPKLEGDNSKVDDQGNNYWELDRNRRVSVSSFKGKQYLNIREYYQDKSSGQWRPGKSGITLTNSEWKQLLDLQPQIKFEN